MTISCVQAGPAWNDGKAYFFNGDEFLRYDIDTIKAERRSKINPAWTGLWSSNIDAAVMWNNGKAYFLKGDEYIRVDVATKDKDPGYPKKINPDGLVSGPVILMLPSCYRKKNR